MEKENHEMIDDKISNMITQILEVCLSWVRTESDGLERFIDPIDRVEISAHYGTTHAAVSFILFGEMTSNTGVSAVGYELLKSILKRWKISANLSGFHNDFNNFALCVLDDYFQRNKSDRHKYYDDAIKKVILATPDSNNPTVNWLPMRWYANLARYRWTGNDNYKIICNKCHDDIKTATYKDGFIDDRLPKGTSFNLQYDVATVAVLQFLRCRGESIDISKELGALLAAVAPDGDINYFGRGTNQIFAWGLWIFLLKSTGQKEELARAVNYLGDKLPKILKNNNLMLNYESGGDKYLWWDYHYCSVYTAHLLFWLIMALDENNRNNVNAITSNIHDSGINIIRKGGWFAVTFSGRREYLSEKGPSLVALGKSDGSMLIKGIFGPLGGAFGNNYTIPDIVIRNYCGLIDVGHERSAKQKRILEKIYSLIKLQNKTKLSILPLFVDIRIHINEEGIVLNWLNSSDCHAMFIFSSYQKINNARLYVDGEKVNLLYTGSIKDQYGIKYIYQGRIQKGSNWKLTLSS